MTTDLEIMPAQQPVPPQPPYARLETRSDPDPSTATTAQLLRETQALKDLFFNRLESMEKAIELVHDNQTQAPTLIDREIEHLKKLQDEKFVAIQTQFKERDVRTEQSSKDSKIAVDAALQAAKEAVGKQQESNSLAIAKSEAATSKQIDQLAAMMNTSTSALSDKIDDQKARLIAIESRSQAKTETVEKNTSANQFAIGLVISTVFSLLGFGIAIFSLFKK